MRNEIDFQQLDVSERDGEEAGLKRIHRAGIKLDVAERVVYLKTGVEDFSEPNDEPSVFDTITDRLYALESEEDPRELIGKAVLMMVMVLRLPRTMNSETLCRAWILDILDERVDINTTNPYNDRWFDHLLYPRLSKLAKQSPEAFRTFQSAMSRFVSLPDLSSQNPVVYRKRPS